jgi:enoyl-CoA hydratase/carnithine racemase
MTYRTIHYEKQDHIATITMNPASPGPDFVRELEELSDEINNDESVYVVILTGTGNTFVDFTDGEPGAAAAIAAIDRPGVAAVNGDARGAGLEIALSCDIRIAAATASFAMPS